MGLINANFRFISDCENLTTLNFNAIYISFKENRTPKLFVNCPNLEYVNFGPKVQIIPQSICSNSKVKSIVIPESVKEIGEAAFSGCKELEKVVFKSYNAHVSSFAFSATDKLKIIEFDDEMHLLLNKQELNSGLYNSTRGAYINGELVTNIIVPDYVTEIADGCLANYELMESITSYGYIKKVGANAFYGLSKTNFVFPQGMEMSTIGDYAFAFSNIKDFSIDTEKEINIGNYAFTGANIENVKIRSNSQYSSSIGSGAFKACDKLKSVKLSFSYPLTLKDELFMSDSSLENLDLSESKIGGVGQECFYDCVSLKKFSPEYVEQGSVKFGAKALMNTQISVLSLPKTSTYMDSETFANLKLETLYFNCKSISKTGDEGAFHNSRIKNLIFGRSVLRLDFGLQLNNSGIETIDYVEFPSSIASISSDFTDAGLIGTLKIDGDIIFGNNNIKAKQIYMKSKEPGMLYEKSFLNRSETTLYVPYGSENTYRETKYWQDFIIVGYDPAGVDNAHMDNGVSVVVKDGIILISGVSDEVDVEVYGMNGSILYKGNETTINAPSKGMYIVKVNGVPFKVIN